MHEYGHFLGLDHSPDAPPSVVMSQSGYAQHEHTLWWTPKRDDIIGLREAYGLTSGLGAPNIYKSTDQGINWRPVSHGFLWPSRYGYSAATDGDLLVVAFIGAVSPTMEGNIYTATSTDGQRWDIHANPVDTDVMRGVYLQRWTNYWILLYLKESGDAGSCVTMKWTQDFITWHNGALPELCQTWHVPTIVDNPAAGRCHLLTLDITGGGNSYVETHTSTSCVGFGSAGYLTNSRANDTLAAVCLPSGECSMLGPAVFNAGMVHGENAIKQYKGVIDPGTNELGVFEVDSAWSETPISDITPTLVHAFNKGFVSYHDARDTRPDAFVAVQRTNQLLPNGSTWAYWSGHYGIRSGRSGLVEFKNGLWLIQ